MCWNKIKIQIEYCFQRTSISVRSYAYEIGGWPRNDQKRILGTIPCDWSALWKIAQGCEQLNKLNKNLFSFWRAVCYDLLGNSSTPERVARLILKSNDEIDVLQVESYHDINARSRALLNSRDLSLQVNFIFLLVIDIWLFLYWITNDESVVYIYFYIQ